MRWSRALWERNRPHAKPELWEYWPEVLTRRITAWLNGTVDPGWWHRPYIATTLPERLLLEVTPAEQIGRPIVYFGVYEYASTRLLKTFLEEGDVFVDVGANLGYYSLLAAHYVGSRGLVIAFEPNLRMYGRLTRNIELNHLGNIDARPLAASCSNESRTLVDPGDPLNAGLSHLDQTGSKTGGMEVNCVCLDDALLGRNVQLIKIDVEGAESQVFLGARGLLSEPEAPALLFESFNIERDQTLLLELGYQIFQPGLRNGRLWLNPNALAAPYRAWEAPNFFAVKSARARAVAARLSSA